MAKSPEALSLTVQSIAERIQSEATKSLKHSKRVILNNLLNALTILVQEETICPTFASVIDRHLCVVYQLVEARVIAEYDQQILNMMKSFVICSKETGINLYQALIYLSEVVGEMPTSAILIFELTNVVLRYGANLFAHRDLRVLPEGNTEAITLTSDHDISTWAKELSNLGYAMANAALKWQSIETNPYGHDGIVSACNISQIVIHVGSC
jgi:hypothetical protein